MKDVEAVKTPQDINLVEHYLDKHHSRDMRDVWTIGIYVALRITDLLGVKYSNINFAEKQLVVIETKTKKKRIITINDKAMDIIKQRRQDYSNDVYLFQSHGNRGRNSLSQMKRGKVSEAFKAVGEMIGIQLGTHSMRKTFGHALYANGTPIEVICKCLNHKDTGVTLRYIGLSEKDTINAYETINFG